MGKTILYDLASKQGGCWSLNPWKTRLALNFKQIPYETQWVEYPDLKDTLSALNIPPNAEGMGYTSPSITLSDGTSMQDSRKIADRLEADHPNPGMHLDAPALKELEALIPRIMGALAPVVMPLVPRYILNERSATYFQTTRATRFGMTLDELEKSDKGGETAWTNAHEPFEEVARLLRRENGPFFLGSGVSYADFVLAGFWRFVERCDEDGKLLSRALGFDEAFGKHWAATKTWTERDD